MSGNKAEMMIKSFKHKGLKQLFEKGIISGIPAQDAIRLSGWVYRQIMICTACKMKSISQASCYMTLLKMMLFLTHLRIKG